MQSLNYEGVLIEFLEWLDNKNPSNYKHLSLNNLLKRSMRK